MRSKSGKVKRVPVVPNFGRFVRGDQIRTTHLFGDCISALRRALKRPDLNYLLDKLHMVLRHTFASHYMMNGGDLLKLQKLLSHLTVMMTMRFADLAPDTLEYDLDKHGLIS